MAQLNAGGGIGVVNYYVTWPNDGILSLIQYRRFFQQEFCRTPIYEQKQIWNQVAQNINLDHPNFAPTKKQCRTKWNSLKSGYENLKRLLNGNPEGFPTHTPTLHDEHFHEELSDEFWLAEPRVRAARRNQVDRRRYEYRECRRSRSQSFHHRHERGRSRSRSPRRERKSVESAGAIIPLTP
ncbi:unnamed protein product [Rhizophagus irregularis]|uniref:Myb/SANT-like DNA-binding domain-containing protein n=1 Tax=Rhizophagus irregularis TaxID=588596 RepID=A0A915YSZ9_9GLOM|nr:unnamed protein product [Rhizophagus irregularis]